MDLIRKGLAEVPGWCHLTFERCGWRLGCSESVNFRKFSLSSVVTRLDFKIVRSGFTEPLYLVCVTRTVINGNKPARKHTIDTI